jgi:hypothetical protein
MVALLLTTFSVLALASARADLRLSEKVVASTQGYYAADGQAAQWLADLDAFLRDRSGADADAAASAEAPADAGTGADAADPADPAAPQADSALAAALSSAGYTLGESAEGRLSVVEEFPIDELRFLAVEVSIDETRQTEVLRWQSMSR